MPSLLKLAYAHVDVFRRLKGAVKVKMFYSKIRALFITQKGYFSPQEKRSFDTWCTFDLFEDFLWSERASNPSLKIRFGIHHEKQIPWIAMRNLKFLTHYLLVPGKGRGRSLNGGGGWLIFIYSCWQTIKTINFKRNE